MKRQQIFDRNEFDYEDRQYIATKSDGLCAHCGRRIEFGGKATVDHFIPLSKGGFNQKCNIVMLCLDCNQEKSNKIICPENYLRYLRPEYYKELLDYFNSYQKSFDYISRGNLLCCDEYVLKLYTPVTLNARTKNKKLLMDRTARYYTLTRARPEDIPAVTEYYVDYLQHYDMLEDKETAQINIEFWNKFGVIYTVKDSDKNIRIMMTIMMHEDVNGKHNLTMRVFSRYKNAQASILIYEIPAFVARTVANEQNLPYLKVITTIIAADNAGRYLPHSVIMPNGASSSFICWRNDDDIDVEQYDENSHTFYQQFKDVRAHMDLFFARPGYENMTYMGEDLIEGYADAKQ